MPGCVPWFEEREAAVYCHYTPESLRDLPMEDRALCVAQYRLAHLVRTHSEDAETRAVLMQAQRQQLGGASGS